MVIDAFTVAACHTDSWKVLQAAVMLSTWMLSLTPTATPTGQSAAGGGDAFTRLQAQKQQEGGPRDSRVTGPIKAKLPALRPLTPPSSIEGLLVPAHPNDQAHMAMLLNQQPGKLMLTDIQAMTALQTAQHRATA